MIARILFNFRVVPMTNNNRYWNTSPSSKSRYDTHHQNEFYRKVVHKIMLYSLTYLPHSNFQQISDMKTIHPTTSTLLYVHIRPQSHLITSVRPHQATFTHLYVHKKTDHLDIKMPSYQKRNRHYKVKIIRRPWDRPIFIMKIPIPNKTVFTLK